MRYDRLSALAVIVAILVTAGLYSRLPDRVPIHFGLSGPDSWGPRYTVFLLPLVALILNITTSGSDRGTERERLLKTRLLTAVVLAVQGFLLWWILIKM